MARCLRSESCGSPQGPRLIGHRDPLSRFGTTGPDVTWHRHESVEDITVPEVRYTLDL